MEQIEDLIFDVGFHKCEDIDYYLGMGYRVVGIDADYSNITEAIQKYRKQVDQGRLIVEHCAISENEEESVVFYKSDYTMWSSMHKEIVDRKDHPYTVESVVGKPLSYFFRKYGTPFYCKIDIEGQDIVALKSLEGLHPLPQYISAESECIGKADRLNKEQVLQTLVELRELGYRKFKLIDQNTLSELRPGIQFFETSLFNQQKRRDLEKKFGRAFPISTSGTFGQYLEGDWLDFDEAAETILFHREGYFKSKRAVNYGFWCDWHATF